ncbi:MAG: hypothetical protein WAM97_10820 [Acidimicrobiales bacterium]
MSPTLAIIVTMAVLCAAGALPARMLAGWRPVTPFLAPIGGAVLAGAAGELTVLVDGTEIGWFVPLAIGANAAATASWLARRESRRSPTAPRPRFVLWIVGGAGVLGVAAATAWSLLSLARVDIGSEARTIWLVHATWIQAGHATALAALTNQGLILSHSSYPPLSGATVALGWAITGVSSLRVGQVVLALLTGCAIAAVGATVLEVGLIAAIRTAIRRNALGATALTVIAGLLSAAWVLGAFGLAGPSATNGSVDMLAAACAVGAAAMGLVLPCGGEHGRAAAVLAVAAGLTTDDGIGAAIVVFVLIGLRWLSAPRHGPEPNASRVERHRGVIGATAAAWGVAGVIAWPVGAAIRRATTDYYLTGPRIGSPFGRADDVFHSMAPDLHLTGLAIVIGIAASVLFRRARRSMGFGSDAWLWVLIVVELLAVGVLYAVGDQPVEPWLHSTAGASALFAECLGLGLLAWWAVIGAAIVLAPKSEQAPEVPVPTPVA